MVAALLPPSTSARPHLRRDRVAQLVHDAHDQRQALRLMVQAKGLPQPLSAAVIEAHRTAIAPLTDLVSKHNDPADYEMLGMCHVVVGDEAAAGAAFRAFMRRISML